MAAPEAEPRAVLFLLSDTGGGHRRAAEAVMSALTARHPGAFLPVVCDPLADGGWLLRRLAALYGPVIRRAPWVWGAAWYLSNSRPAMALLGRTVLAGASRPVAAAVRAHDPALIVSCHPLTGRAAVAAAGLAASEPARVLTLVTDLAAVHASWLHPAGARQLFAVPTAVVAERCAAAGITSTETGLPVAADQAPAGHRAALRAALGLGPSEFVVLLTGGGEGCGGLARRAAAIRRRFGDAHVVTICGRNDVLERRLAVRPDRPPGRLTVLGFVGNFTDWLQCADIVITKAGPGIIAEAACCGTPLLLTSHLPGQERGNAGLVTRAGAGCQARGTGGMLRELRRLRSDPAALAAMGTASRTLARPAAAAEVADLAARLAGPSHPRLAALAGGQPAGRPESRLAVT
jgi:1,2-diacylglycerol 3-beta-galactosyltransferase